MKDDLLEIGEAISLETESGWFNFRYASLNCSEALIISKDPVTENHLTVRIHSSCVFSESFHTIDCDCSDQLNDAITIIAAAGGLIIYLFEEGRGVGLKNKINAIKLQSEKGLNTVEAFKMLGFSSDERSFDLAIYILKELYSDKEIELITNNPLKIEKLKSAGIKVLSVQSSIHAKNDTIKKYLIDKRQNLGHNIDLDE